VPEPTDLVRAYWTYHSLRAGGREEQLAADEWFWAWEAVQETVHSDPSKALEIVAALVETAPGEADVDYIGAGPLEDLVREHGPMLIDQIDMLARRAPRFRRAVNAMWLSEDVPAPVRQRLERFSTDP
jgi:hypothetical protein